MLEVIACIILAPLALCAIIFTVALGIGIVKAFQKKK